MLQRPHRLFAAVLCVLSCLTAAAVFLQRPARDVRTADRNGDGRPDAWRVYDREGRLSELDLDANFDGRAEIHEIYERGVLARRETDRNFNDRVDLVEDFDTSTHELVRSVEDVDFDGVADLLRLFRNGQPVYSKRAAHRRVTPVNARGRQASGVVASRRTANDALAPLEDPFRADLAVTATHVAASSRDTVGLSTSGGLPVSRTGGVEPLPTSSRLSVVRFAHHSFTPAGPYAPRGPPAPHLLA